MKALLHVAAICMLCACDGGGLLSGGRPTQPTDPQKPAPKDPDDPPVGATGTTGKPTGPTGVTGPTAPTAAFDVRNWTPAAKGLWIWRFDYIGKTAAEVAEVAQAAGVGWVLIKSGQDERYWETRYNAESVAEFTSRGMRVFAWPYITLEDIPGSIAATVAAANVPGTDGVILDVESEWEVSGAAEQAEALCLGIRAQKPGVFLGYTSFGWVKFHGSFPFAAFDAHCGDAFFPQVYWSDRGVSYDFGYQQAMDHLADSGLQAPLWIVQSNDTIYNGGEPTSGELNAFFSLSGARSSLWMFPNQGEEAKVQQLSELHWQN